MITRRTKLQLMVFVLITLLGVSYVGARYARLGSLFTKDHFDVAAHLANGGGVYTGAEVDYRGVKIGQVGDLTLNRTGVDADLKVDKAWRDKIPADTLAVVGNRSAVGEQYIELQPQSNSGPYLNQGSSIKRANTSIPLPTEKLLGDLATTVDSVDKKSLSTTVNELGTAFSGTGDDLQQIVDTGTAFVNTANENFDVTSDLISDTNTVLKTQMDSTGSIKSFASDLNKFTTTLAGSNNDLISLIDNGSASADELRTFLEQNQVNLGQLLREVLTTGKIVRQNIPGLDMALVIYPWVVEGGFGVLAKDPSTGLEQAHFGLVLTSQSPCHKGYESTDTRSPLNLGDRKLNKKAHCAEPASQSDARGAAQAPRAATDYNTVASYDSKTGKVTWGSPEDGATAPAATPAPKSYGDQAWKWLYLEPMTAGK